MKSTNCEFCLSKIWYSLRNFKKYSPIHHVVLCDQCINNNILFTKNYCQKNLYLSENEICSLKFLFSPNTNKKLYIEQLINKFFVEKYGSHDVIKSNIYLKENKKLIRQIKKNKIIDERRKQLMELIYNNKLDFKEVGICYTHINYGIPTACEVVDILMKKNNLVNEKKIKLLNLFEQNHIEYNEQMLCCKEYIDTCDNYQVDNKEIIKKAKFEDFLMKNTKYLNYLKVYNNCIAEKLAIEECHNKKLKLDSNNKINNKIIVEFN